MTKFSRQPSRDSDNDDFNRRVTEWLSSRPEKPDCQLDSKEAVIRDLGYRKKKNIIITQPELALQSPARVTTFTPIFEKF